MNFLVIVINELTQYTYWIFTILSLLFDNVKEGIDLIKY